jgi:prevent-host-death family protein
MRTIGQRELRNDNAKIMREVEEGQSFVITRNGKPVAELVPIRKKRITGREAQALMSTLPPIDIERWYRDRDADDEIFGDDRIEY